MGKDTEHIIFFVVKYQGVELFCFYGILWVDGWVVCIHCSQFRLLTCATSSYAPCTLPVLSGMAPHLMPSEQDLMPEDKAKNKCLALFEQGRVLDTKVRRSREKPRRTEEQKEGLTARQLGGQPGRQPGSQTATQLARHQARVARSQALTVSISQRTVSIQSAVSQHSSQHLTSPT